MKRVVVLLLVFALIGWQVYLRIVAYQKPKTMNRQTPPVAVEVKPVQKTMVREMGLFTGSLYPRAQFIVAPKIAGRLEKLLVKIGDPVKRDQVIAVLEDDEYLQQVEQARAELDVARANLEESKSSLETGGRELERAKVLRQKKIASESELDAAEAQFSAQSAKQKVAVAQVEQKEAALKGAQVRLSYTQIRASWREGDRNRVVGERFVDEGSMLAPNSSIVSILDIDTLIAVIHIIERDYSKVRIGQEGTMETDAFPGKAFSGKVVRIAPLLKETSREARVEMEVPNPQGLLKPGMFIRVQIEFAAKKEATVVPIGALTKRNSKEGIFLADPQERKAHFVPVTLGIMNKEWAEIVNPAISGLVVTVGHHLL
ncbi:MAG: efflux RND transporter periplasmic adaptor subunit, partial [Proteobacteria bacterium]|nr:efflux RND transporter periplasmic adaptor subunit [Pseudomonadota bacterium]